MPHAVESMMYAGQTPWHGLGKYVGDQNVTSDEALKLAGLDWDVELRNVRAEGDGIIPGYKAVVRMTDNKPLGIVGDRYRPIQNKGKFSFMDEIVGNGQAIYHTAGSLFGGRKIWILAKLPNDIVVLNGKDVSQKYLLLSDSFDGTSTLKCFFTSVRVVCANTHRIALGEFSSAEGISIRHTVNAQDKIEEAKRILGFATVYFDQFQQKIEHLSRTAFSKSQMASVVESLFPVNGDEVSTRTQNNRDTLLSLFETGRGMDQIPEMRGTAWAAFNAVSEYSDHHRGSRETQNSAAENRLNSIWFGPAQQFKAKGFDLIDKAIANA